MSGFTRRNFLYGAGAVIAGALTAEGCVLEPDTVEFTEHEIGTPRGRGTIRFAQLSDLHVTGMERLHVEIAARLAALRLDFLVITGDAIDARHHIGDLDNMLRLLPAIPKYAILGNWEHWGKVHFGHLTDLYCAYQGDLLINRTAVVDIRGTRLNLTGLDDAVGGKPSLETALKGVYQADHHIVLAHCPIYRDYLADYTHTRAMHESYSSIIPVDLERYRISTVLSGHTHGGQISLLGWQPYLPEGSGQYIKGWYRDRTPHLYVSRGVGTSVVRARLGSVPEVPVFTLHV